MMTKSILKKMIKALYNIKMRLIKMIKMSKLMIKLMIKRTYKYNNN